MDKEKLMQQFRWYIEHVYHTDENQEMLEQILTTLKEQEELLCKKQDDINRLCSEISQLKHQLHPVPDCEHNVEGCIEYSKHVFDLLKKQEPKQVERLKKNCFFPSCPSCHKDLNFECKFCDYCGQAVKWDDL